MCLNLHLDYSTLRYNPGLFNPQYNPGLFNPQYNPILLIQSLDIILAYSIPRYNPGLFNPSNRLDDLNNLGWISIAFISTKR